MTGEEFAGLPIQSHFVRAGRQGERRRNWSLFFFFRIMSEAEMNASIGRVLGEPSKEEAKAFAETGLAMTPLTPDQFKLELANPTLWSASFVPDASQGEVGFVESGNPAILFREWLKAVAEGHASSFLAQLKKLLDRFEGKPGDSTGLSNDAQLSFLQAFAESPAAHDGSIFLKILLRRIEQLADDADDEHGLRVLKQGLVIACAYELIRHVCRAVEGVPLLRSAAWDQAARRKTGGDRSPIEIAFTYSGLQALKVDPGVLDSFPDVFKDGMAARAARLGDVGESAPTHWTGELGQVAVHGMLTGGFAVEGAKEDDWEGLRQQVTLFNNAGPGPGQELRTALGFIFRAIGMEILHIELGQDPYNVASDGTITWPAHRHEHFGFRDGISQPFQDLELRDPPAGSGTPSRYGSWTPVAPGEIFLGMPDEDDAIQKIDDDEMLSKGGTYLVFRKLHQDVGGFRTFLARARPDSKSEQERLAAQFVGRWTNGVSLVDAPFAPPGFGEDQEADLNNFRYSAEDPTGRRCPLGAHVRRANPRDIGGQNQAKRHRILRRGMAYGGPFLPEGSIGDGKERGMLFIALNARIDLQFELIQSRWINGGEFLGQAGLGKCPVIGANQGRRQDQFLEAGAIAPLNCLPAFVRMQGGDYFFAPGLDALKEIANHTTFKPVIPKKGHGIPKTDDIFDSKRLNQIGGAILKGVVASQRDVMPPLVGQPAGVQEDPDTPKAITFVALHQDVGEVLSGDKTDISVPHYVAASQRMMGGATLLISTDKSTPISTSARTLMKTILVRAWERLLQAHASPQPPNAPPAPPSTIASALFGGVLDKAIDRAIRRTKQVGVIDLVQDLAVDPLYDVVEKVYGVRGPNWLTELAVALPFARQHVTEIHPDWLAMLSGKSPTNPRLATLQVWSILLFSDLIGNIRMQEELKALSMQAGSECAAYLSQLLMRARTRPPPKVRTLVDAFVAVEGQFTSQQFTPPQYYLIVRALLTELIASALAVIPATFGSLMVALLANRANLGFLVPALDAVPYHQAPADPDAGVKRLIYETNRISPSLPLLQRYAAEQITLKSKVKINKGEWIGALAGAANFDPRVFGSAEKFSLYPFLSGPPRDLQKYLMFGPYKTDRACWGEDKLAMLALVRFIRAAARLPGLRRVAGPGGAPLQLLRSVIGLPARFARH